MLRVGFAHAHNIVFRPLPTPYRRAPSQYTQATLEHESVLANAYLNQTMAEEVGSAASAGAKAALNSFMNPSIDIVKTIPQGIIELILRGTNVVI